MPPTRVDMVSTKPRAERRRAGRSMPPSQTTQKPDGSTNLIKRAPTEPEAIPGPQDIGCTMRNLRRASNPTTTSSQAGEFKVRGDSNDIGRPPSG